VGEQPGFVETAQRWDQPRDLYHAPDRWLLKRGAHRLQPPPGAPVRSEVRTHPRRVYVLAAACRCRQADGDAPPWGWSGSDHLTHGADPLPVESSVELIDRSLRSLGTEVSLDVGTPHEQFSSDLGGRQSPLTGEPSAGRRREAAFARAHPIACFGWNRPAEVTKYRTKFLTHDQPQ